MVVYSGKSLEGLAICALLSLETEDEFEPAELAAHEWSDIHGPGARSGARALETMSANGQ